MVKLDGTKRGGSTRGRKLPHKEAGGNTVADKEIHEGFNEAREGFKAAREGMFDTFSKLTEPFLSMDGAKKAAAWYIDTSEKFAKQAIELQEKATSWAKDTPLAPLVEAQNSIARKFVERSASAARNLWQIQSHHR
jgi:phage shock protein A